MPTLKEIPYSCKYKIVSGQIDFATDSFILALMQSTYTFDPANDDVWGDVSASALGSGNGYAGPISIGTPTVVTENGIVKISWADELLSATGGSIGPFKTALIYDSTVSNTIVAAYTLYAAKTIVNGSSYLLKDLQIELR